MASFFNGDSCRITYSTVDGNDCQTNLRAWPYVVLLALSFSFFSLVSAMKNGDTICVERRTCRCTRPGYHFGLHIVLIFSGASIYQLHLC